MVDSCKVDFGFPAVYTLRQEFDCVLVEGRQDSRYLRVGSVELGCWHFLVLWSYHPK